MGRCSSTVRNPCYNTPGMAAHDSGPNAAYVAQRVLNEQAVKQAEAVVQQTKLFVDAGTKAPVELMVATADLERSRADLATAEGRVAYARSALATAMGVPLEQIQDRRRWAEVPSGPSPRGGGRLALGGG